ncbi:response regulator [Paracraurococcus lichenis]|uniref:Response regulator n=1 Tax=Paracraurococcus lichenis TaxID=3064888 RepID=A0ABT9EDF7_9PROT|nr:response regulator [Paracraurococcus sp. LOR1-02]MDO9713925.1 response regulator [Paracraurococcus sp. LOR1-02]
MTILIVEDEPLLLMMLLEEFEAAGLEVSGASTAEAALVLLNSAGRVKPSVVVTDLNLGLGMVGVALAAEMRRQLPRVTVIYATGNASWLAGQSGAFRPGDKLFGKPYDLSGLVAAVHEALACQLSPSNTEGRQERLRFGSDGEEER